MKQRMENKVILLKDVYKRQASDHGTCICDERQPGAWCWPGTVSYGRRRYWSYFSGCDPPLSLIHISSDSKYVFERKIK